MVLSLERYVTVCNKLSPKFESAAEPLPKFFQGCPGGDFGIRGFVVPVPQLLPNVWLMADSQSQSKSVIHNSSSKKLFVLFCSCSSF